MHCLPLPRSGSGFRCGQHQRWLLCGGGVGWRGRRCDLTVGWSGRRSALLLPCSASSAPLNSNGRLHGAVA